MSQFISAVFILLISSGAHAVTVKITGKNRAALFETEIASPIPSDVGSVTIVAFDAAKIPYQGSSNGISKIYDLDQQVEVVSNIEMRAYGWCFAIDGQVPETMPNNTDVLTQQTVVEWYYAYAHYKSGDWIGQCVRD